MKTVAVTTSADRAAAAAIPFTLAGLAVKSLPCIEIHSAHEDLLAAVRASIDRADLVVAGSRRTIELLWPEGPLPACDFAAVGRVTARSIEDRDGKVAYLGTGGAAELADDLADRVAGAVVIWPHAEGADPAPLKQISNRASVFAAPTLYTAMPQAPALDRVDMVTFASPSAVQGWVLSRSLDEAPLAVIGNTTRQALERLDSEAAVVAPAPTFQALAQVVAGYLGVPA